MVFAFFCGIAIKSAYAQSPEQKSSITAKYNLPLLKQLANELKDRENKARTLALAYAKSRNLPTKITFKDGGIGELQAMEKDGTLIYYRTNNIAAAVSTRANQLHTGGLTGYNLDGQNMIAYVWDAGHARLTHQEYDGPGGTNRVSVIDASRPSLNYHAAHVTGTIIASGFVAKAKGMAPQAKVNGYNWTNDLSEATTAAANGMLLSNHSYGWSTSGLPNYYFGAYLSIARSWDQLHFDAPYYLMVKSAGNDGTNSINTSPLDPENPQYDKLVGVSVSKNNLVIASANDASIDANGNLISVSISSFSSQGPTDDLRIKPDITGNGASVYSTYHSSDKAYNSISGTSMSAPNVTGTLLLLQQHAKNITGEFLLAATLKGLVLHTADDAGMTGPDAIWGWGLLNGKKAAEAITVNGVNSLVMERELLPGETYTFTVNSDGINKLMASISWTDPPGVASSTLNLTTPVLVNDLDIRVSQNGTTWYPWRLTGVNTNGLGDNIADPYERIEVSNASGTYTISVSHKGNLTNNKQNYSLIVTGVNNQELCEAVVPAGLNITNITENSASVNWQAVQETIYDIDYQPAGATGWTRVTANESPYIIQGLSELSGYNVRIRSRCTNGNVSDFSASISFTTPGLTDNEAPTIPGNLTAINITQNSLGLSWSASTDNIGVTGYDVYMNGTLKTSVTSTNALLDGLSPATSYSFYVTAKDAAGNISGESSSISVTTPGIMANYCLSYGVTNAVEYIQSVKVGNFSNNSGNNSGYGDFTSQTISLSRTGNTITITPGWVGKKRNEAYRVWIDYNGDGDFNDAGELVYTRARTTASPVTGTFVIPEGVTAKTTRMRVSMKFKNYPSRCETNFNGEVEDYLVNIPPSENSNGEISLKSATIGTEIREPVLQEFKVYPNPAGEKLNMIFNGYEPTSVRIFNSTGMLVLDRRIENSIDISKLSNGLYIIEILDGQNTLARTRFIRRD